MFFDTLPSPLGDLALCADEIGITAVAFPGEYPHGATPNPQCPGAQGGLERKRWLLEHERPRARR